MQANDTPRLNFISSEAEAVQAMTEATRRLGFEDAAILEDSQLTGLDIAGSGCVARIRFSGQVNVSDIQRLVAVREIERGVQLLAFSASGFSAATVSFGQEHDVALLSYDPRGAITAHTDAAHALIRNAPPTPSPMPGASAVAPPQEQPPPPPPLPLHRQPHTMNDPFTREEEPHERRRSLRGWWWRWPLLALTILCGFGTFVMAFGLLTGDDYWFGLGFYGVPLVAGTWILQWHRRRRTYR